MTIKGQCHETFNPRLFSLKHPPWAPNSGAKAISNINSNSRRYLIAQYNFQTTLKSINHMQNGDAMQKKYMHDWWTIRTALAAFKGNIYKKKNINMFRNCPTQLIKIYKFKGATKQNFLVHGVSLTMHARFLHSKIYHFLANLKQNSKKLYLACDQGPRGYCLMKKTRGHNSCDTERIIRIIYLSPHKISYTVVDNTL
jgi:hypothetical protein